MGFMDLSISGSDQAFDSASLCVDAFAKQLNIEFKDKANMYNTPGPLNVAMIIVEMCNHSMFIGNDEMHKLAKKCLTWLEKTPEYGCPTSNIKKGIEKFIKEY